MITAKQAKARRRIGRLSHGPKTPEGKAEGAFFTKGTYRFSYLAIAQSIAR
jgi:hypothetical protein